MWMGLNDLYYVHVLFYCNLTVNKWTFPKTYNFQILLNIASLLLEIINKSYLLQQGTWLYHKDSIPWPNRKPAMDTLYVCRVEIYANFCKDLQILHYANAL